MYSKLLSSKRLDFANAILILVASARGKNTVLGVKPVSTSFLTSIASMIFNSFSITSIPVDESPIALMVGADAPAPAVKAPRNALS